MLYCIAMHCLFRNFYLYYYTQYQCIVYTNGILLLIIIYDLIVKVKVPTTLSSKYLNISYNS